MIACVPGRQQFLATQEERNMTIDFRRLFLSSVTVLPLCLSTVSAPAESAEVPRHLTIARELVQNMAPENNRYVLGSQFISFPGDAPTSKYAMRADCSGFLLAIFERAGYSTRSEMTFLDPSPKRKRPAAEDFVHSIEQEKGFRRVPTVEDMRPGDLLAHAMLKIDDKKQTGTTGHIFLINSRPQPIAARKPVVAGTRQFEVSIIDSNEEYVGSADSRLADPANKITGLGTGTIRIYADAQGELVGWARTFAQTARFFSYSPRFPSDTKARKAVIGRPQSGNRAS